VQKVQNQGGRIPSSLEQIGARPLAAAGFIRVTSIELHRGLRSSIAGIRGLQRFRPECARDEARTSRGQRDEADGASAQR
jgi:hypothetical protein